VTDEALRVPKRGPMTSDAPDYDGLYRDALQGDFYGADYYRPPASDIDSAIIYDDNEDKRATAAFVTLNFGPRRVLEVGCAMGLLVKALRGWGVEAEGVDFSRWCVDHAHPAARAWVRWGDVLSLPRPAGPHDVVLALDILEHLPPDRVPAALHNLAGALRPGGLVFTVIPAYGPNAFGPELYPLQYEEWRRDAERGRPFRNIPLDDKGRPHLGHLTHAAIPWWDRAFRRAGLWRLGEVERLLHERFDVSFEYPRRSFFVFTRSGRWGRTKTAKALLKRVAAVPGLPYGFYEWERWGEDLWMRWTFQKAWDPLPVCGRSELRLRAICNHPGIGENPVRVAFRVEGGGESVVEFRNHDWHDVRLALPSREFAELRIQTSRTWVPNDGAPPALQRRLGVGLAYPRE
jgi:SAM-dependent methyltransferase